MSNRPPIDLTTAEPLPKLAKRVPFSHTTLWRACTKGDPVTGCRMRHARVGRRLFSTLEAVNEHFSECAMATPVKTERTSTPTTRKPADRQRSIEAAEAELDRMGIR